MTPQLVSNSTAPENATPVASELLTQVEARLVHLAKERADHLLQQELRHVIAGHGFDPDDGRKYNFTLDDGEVMRLEVW